MAPTKGIVDAAAEAPEEQALDTGPEEVGADIAQDAAAANAPTTSAAPAEKPDGSLEDDTPNVSPEEQKQYEAVMIIAHQKMFTKTAFPVLLRKLADGQEDIGLTIGHTAAMILQSTVVTINNAGKEVPEDMLLAVGQEILDDLMEVAAGSNMVTSEKADAVATRALFEGMKIFGNNMIRSGVSEDARKAADQDVRKLGITPQQASGVSSNAGGGDPRLPSPPPPPAGPPGAGIVNQAGA